MVKGDKGKQHKTIKPHTALLSDKLKGKQLSRTEGILSIGPIQLVLVDIQMSPGQLISLKGPIGDIIFAIGP